MSDLEERAYKLWMHVMQHNDGEQPIVEALRNERRLASAAQTERIIKWIHDNYYDLYAGYADEIRALGEKDDE